MGKSAYKIQFGGLPIGVHEFELEIKDKFFTEIENSEITRADVKVKAILTKQNNLLNLDFDIAGTVGVSCDRCLKDFDLPIEASESLVIKYGNPDESNDEILVIPEGDTEVELSHYLYEYIALAVPARKVPCELDAEEFDCDDEMLEKLSDISHSAEEEKEPNNPMWEQLNKIKKFNQN